MSARHTLCVLSLLLLGGAPAARADKVTTLDNKTVSGTIVEVTDKVVAVKTESGKIVETPLAEVLALDLREAKSPAGVTYSDVRLLDETLLHCSDITFKGADVYLKLLSKQEVKVPLAYVTSILHDAQEPELRKQWEELLAEPLKRDRLVIYKNGRLNPLRGTFGDVDPKGERIQFRTETGKTLNPVLRSAALKGMSFYRSETPAKEPVCLVYDVQGNSLAALKVRLKDKTFTVTTPGGIEINLDQANVARFDYNMGKLTYLSGIRPSKLTSKAYVGGGLTLFCEDLSLDGKGAPIMLEGKIYPKGLSIHATTEVEYNLAGKYKQLKALVGVGDRLKVPTSARLVVRADGQEVYNQVIASTEPARAISLPVQKAQRLTIRVTTSDPDAFDDSLAEITLADAKVTQ